MSLVTKREAFLIAVLILCWAITFLQRSKVKEQQKMIAQYQSELQIQKNLADSLSAELFPAEVELNRFRIAFEIFARRHPQQAETYAAIISDETE